MPPEQNRDLLLTPKTFVYMQNEGKNGLISVYVGPGVVNQTGQDKPVTYDPQKRSYRHIDLANAVQQFSQADEGDYVILENPSDNEKFPSEPVQQAARLHFGRKVVIPGPWSQPLWPGQSVKVIPGHRLRSNQYLVVVIYNEDEARRNWGKAIVKTATTEDAKTTPQDVSRLSVGQRLIIRGTDVSFYIPSTGIEVLPDENQRYVREALTLEQLEYCILVDESGRKRYVRGPTVVFPEPTERFVTGNEGALKFRAIELNEIQGIHIKVIEAYTEAGREYREGEELFITGKETAIYFPRKEHASVSYGEQFRHYATAIPEGEARYVMDRTSGEIKTVRGPTMLLPDPRTKVIVRRVLTDKQCELWYPGNQEALAYNRHLGQMAATQPGVRQGIIAEGEYLRNVAAEAAPAPPTHQAPGAKQESFKRGTSYTQPRAITLNTRFEGVPAINLWTGYAVMVVAKTGERRVEVGPKTILLNYDETLETLTLSTGKPKTTDRLLSSVYLRVANNKVSDIVAVETKDHVKAHIQLSLKVNFTGDPKKWFDVENYVKFLTDHVRSVLKGVVKRQVVEEFYAGYLPIIRNAVLGEKPTDGTRPGMLFSENGMHVVDVEVLDVTLDNPEIAEMLNDAQLSAVRQHITLGKSQREMTLTVQQEDIARQLTAYRAETKRKEAELLLQQINSQLQVALAEAASAMQAAQKQAESAQAEEAVKNLRHLARLNRVRARTEVQHQADTQAQELANVQLTTETAAAVQRLTAAKDTLGEALVALGREEVLVKVAEAVKIDTFLSGQSMEGALARVFAGFPMLNQVLERVTGATRNGTPSETR